MKHYFIEFDAGLVLCTAGFALILLPFSIASSSAKKWASGSIISILVIGVASMIGFVIWERYGAKVQFMPFRYLADWTILGACICYGVLFFSVYFWDIYFSSCLQVVNRQPVKNAGYILNTYSLCSSVVSPFVGYIMSKIGRFKYLAYCAIPFAILGTALLIYFRHPGTHVSYLVMCQIFNVIAGATIPFCTSMAVMSSVPHNEVAVVLAIHALFGSIGAAFGESISGAIWTNFLPGALQQYLPDERKSEWLKIYDSPTVQLGYQWGSPTRTAIIEAYGVVQRKMVIAGAAFLPLMLASIMVWKNIDTRTLKQTKGTVF